MGDLVVNIANLEYIDFGDDVVGHNHVCRNNLGHIDRCRVCDIVHVEHQHMKEDKPNHMEGILDVRPNTSHGARNLNYSLE